MSRTHFLRVSLVAGAVLLAAACSEDRAEINSPVGRIYNARFSPVAATLPTGTVSSAAAAAPSTKRILTITLREMESLGTGSYAVWLSTQTRDTMSNATIIRAAGRLVVVHTDTTFNAAGDPVPVVDSSRVRTNTNEFSEGGSRTFIRLRVDSASLAAAGAADLNPGDYGVVFVTIEPTAGATAPTADAPHPLWARRYVNATGVTSNTTANFAFGDFAPNPANQRVFQVSGHGMIGIWDKTLVVDDSALTLPPKGYFYATSIFRGVPVADSTETQNIFLGPQKAPYPRRTVSLYNADVDPSIDPTVSTFPPSILAASERVRVDTLSNATLSSTLPFQGYQRVVVTLEAKQGIDAASPAIVLSAGFPDIVAKAP